jgi:NADPH-dependent curcumin reductase CurA
VQGKRIVLARRPDGLPRRDDFRLETVDIPAAGDGQVLVHNIYCTADPGSRGRLSGEKSYARPLELGEPIEGSSIGQVIASHSSKFAVGDFVAGAFGWQEYGLSDGRGLRKIKADAKIPLTTHVGVLGIPGLTAYFGLKDLGKPQPGETVLISSAAGAVGATAGQIARMLGCRVVGIAGGPEKCRWLREEMGFDATIDHKQGNLAQAIAAACPNGVNVFFDNVGGKTLEAAVANMAMRGRIVISGQVSEYNKPAAERTGLRNVVAFIGQRLRMEGLVVFDYSKQFSSAIEEMSGWIRDGRLKFREEVTQGIESLPDLFIGLLSGRNFGRPLAQIRNLP